MIEFPKVVTDKFNVIPGPIGGGNFGQVWRVREKSNINLGSQKLYAMKRIITPPGDRRSKKNIDNEIRILSEINNEYIVHLKLKIENGNEVYIIMDYFENKDLSIAIVDQNEIPFQEIQIWKFLIQICLGLKCLHSNNIIHRDIKPQNIFLDRNNNIKIGDFGLSRYSIASGPAGTQIYFSPEEWMSEPPSYESDIWALGCVLYELCNFEHPFGNNRGRIISRKHNSIRSQYSDELRYVVDWCLEKAKEKRPTIYMLLEREFIVEKATNLGIDLYDNYQQNDSNVSPDSVMIKIIIEDMNEQIRVMECLDTWTCGLLMKFLYRFYMEEIIVIFHGQYLNAERAKYKHLKDLGIRNQSKLLVLWNGRGC